MSTIPPSLPSTPKQEPRASTLFESFLVNTGAKVWTIGGIYPQQILKLLAQSNSTEAGHRPLVRDWRQIYNGVGLYMLNAPLVGLMGALDAKSRQLLSNHVQRELTQWEKLSIAIGSASPGSYLGPPWI